MKFEDLKKLEVGYTNTPLEYLPRISEDLGNTRFYLKRDDLSGLALGGNKTRKLDYIVRYALAHGYTTLMTYGGVQTNHGRLTAAAAVKYGLKSILILKGKRPDYLSGNLLLDQMMGAELHFVDLSVFDKDPKKEVKSREYLREYAEKLIREKEAQGEKVLDIPVGGQSLVGAAGYIDAARELMEQLEAEKIHADYVVCGYGSTGTFAGLWAGARYYHAPFEVIGITIEPDYVPAEQTADFINQISEQYEMGFICRTDELRIEAGSETIPYGGTGYNVPDEKTWKAVQWMAEKEAVILDPCYTGKVFCGIADMIQKKVIPEGKTVVMIHTGGAPGLWGKEQLDFAQQLFWKDKTAEPV